MTGLRTVRRRFGDPRVQKSMFRVLRENTLCSIATVGPRNQAHINTAYFSYSPDLELYFLSDVDSLHCRNLERSASMAMTIFRSAQAWGVPNRGIQLFGTARQMNGVQAERAERFYGRRFPLYIRYMRSTRSRDRRMGDQLRSYRFYRFVPRTLKILDETEFGGSVFVVATVPRPKGSG